MGLFVQNRCSYETVIGRILLRFGPGFERANLNHFLNCSLKFRLELNKNFGHIFRSDLKSGRSFIPDATSTKSSFFWLRRINKKKFYGRFNKDKIWTNYVPFYSKLFSIQQAKTPIFVPRLWVLTCNFLTCKFWRMRPASGVWQVMRLARSRKLRKIKYLSDKK